MKKPASFWISIALCAVFILLPFLFFFDSFFGGKAILGVDGSYSLRMYINQFVSAGYNQYWLGLFWLGQNGGSIPMSLWIFAMQVFPMELSLTIAYSITISLSLIFTYLLLRKFKLPWLAALFGAIAYSFTPHFLTLIMAGHIGVISMFAYPPMIFFFLTKAFERGKKNIISIIASLILAGMAWGLMMGDDIQRGLYFSIVIGVYLIYKIFTGSVQDDSGEDKPFDFNHVKAVPLLKGFGMALITGLVLFLVFINSFASQINSVSFKGSQGSQSETKEPEQSDSEKWDFATSWSMDPFEMIDNLAFGYHGAISGDPKMPYWGTKPYCGNSESVGYFVLIFAVFGIILGWKKKEPVMKIFFWSGIAAVLLSFGKFFPGTPFYWLWYHIPFMDKLRAPAKFISVFAFSFSIVAAFGLNYIYQVLRKPGVNMPVSTDKKAAVSPEKKDYNIVFYGMLGLFAIGMLWMMGVLLSSGSIMAGIGKSQYDNMLASLFRMNIYTVLTIGVVFLVTKIKKEQIAPMAFFAPFVVLIFFELWSIDFFYIQKSYVKPAEYFAKDGVIDKIKSDPGIFRVATSFHLTQNGQFFPIPLSRARSFYLTYTFPYYNIEALDVPAASRVEADYTAFFTAMIEGVLPTPPQSVEDVIKMNTRLLRIANVKYLLTDGYMYAGQPAIVAYALTNNTNYTYLVGAAGAGNVPHYLFEVKDTLPRAALYENYLGLTNEQNTLAAIANPVFDPKKLVVSEGLISSYGTNIGNYIPVTTVEYKPWLAVFKTSSAKGGLFLHNIKYDPVWKVYIDGQKAELIKANFIMQGVMVGAGEHQVEFRYEPDPKLFKVSFYTLIACLGIGALFLIYSVIVTLTKKEEA